MSAERPEDRKTLNQYLDPHSVFDLLRESGRAARITTAYAGDAWVVTRYDDAHRLMGDRQLSVEARHARHETRQRLEQFDFRVIDATPHSMASLDPPDHSRLRRLVSQAFTARRIAALEPMLRATTRRLLDDVDVAATVDLVRALAEPLPLIAICALLGLDDADAALLRPLVERQGLLPVGDAARRDVARARTAFTSELAAMIERKRARPDDGLLNALIAGRDRGDALSDDELLSTVGLLFAAGVETTTKMIGAGLLLLLRHPEQLIALREDPDLMPRAVEEMLRFDGPVTMGVMRYAAADVELGEVTIARGDLVYVGVAPANHDPRRFPDADRFDVTRHPNPHLAFGRGPHYCLGAPLARLELSVVFSELLQRFPHLDLAVEPDDVVWQASALRGPASLPVWLDESRIRR